MAGTGIWLELMELLRMIDKVSGQISLRHMRNVLGCGWYGERLINSKLVFPKLTLPLVLSRISGVVVVPTKPS